MFHRCRESLEDFEMPFQGLQKAFKRSFQGWFRPWGHGPYGLGWVQGPRVPSAVCWFGLQIADLFCAQ